MARVGLSYGHGGADPGIVGLFGQKESKTNRNVGKYLLEMLENDGHQVFETNPNDLTIKSDRRADLVNRWGADLYIDIHHNGGGGDGAEVFYQMKSSKSKFLGQSVLNELSKINNVRGLKIRESLKYPGCDYHASLAIPRCPSIIVETAFLDSKDIECVNTREEQKAEAKAIYNGIRAYLKEMRK